MTTHLTITKSSKCAQSPQKVFMNGHARASEWRHPCVNKKVRSIAQYFTPHRI